MIKQIKGFENYFVDETGKIYSNNKHPLKEIKPWLTTNKYYMIRLIKNGVHYKKLVHRIVAETFIPNSNNYPEVNHKDNNTKNNNVNNLEWCTRKMNLEQSYKTLSPCRNFITCDLYVNSCFIKSFKSVLEASIFANQEYNASISMLRKHKKYKNITLVLHNS